MGDFKDFLSENWDKKDDKAKKKQDAYFVSCDERKTSERSKFDEYEKEYGKIRVDECCQKKGNRKREYFEKCLKGV